MNDELRSSFVEMHGLKPSNRRKTKVCALLGRQSCTSVRTSTCLKGLCPLSPPDDDHGQFFNRDGKPVVYVYHSYNIGYRIEDLGDYAREIRNEHGLHINVESKSFYYEDTIQIEIWKSEEDYDYRRTH